ncbi:hypothetical protein ACYATM_00640 [Lactobacillaceae bacterium Scapto_B20]
MLFIIQPDKKIAIQNKITRQSKILQTLYYALAIWIVPSYLEFLHVGGIKLPFISVTLILLSTIFFITHRQHLTVTGCRANYQFLLTWITVVVLNTAVQILIGTMAYSLMGATPNFAISFLISSFGFICILSYAMTVLIFYEPNHFRNY